MLLTTNNPQHGRHALRVIIPSDTPLVFPVSSTTDVGLPINPGLTYNISFFARCETRGGMRVDLLLRPRFSGDVPDPAAIHAPAVVGATLSKEWQRINATVTATSAGSLHLRATGRGELFLDHVQVSAKTKAGEPSPTCA